MDLPPPLPSGSPPPAPVGPPLLVKLGVLLGGLAILGFGAVRPMYLVAQHEGSVSVSFKLIFLGAMMAMAGLNLTVMGEHAMPWKKRPEDPVTRPQMVGIVVAVGAALAVVGGVWWFF